jgi:hypothetical protein
MLGSETKSAFNVPRIGEGQSVDIGNFESHVRYPTRSAHRLRLLPILNQVFCRASVCARLETRSSSNVTGLLSGSAIVLLT